MKKKLIKNTIRSLALVFSVAIATSCVSCGGGGGNFSGTLNVLFPNSGITDDKFVDNSTTRAIEEFTGQKVNYSQMLGLPRRTTYRRFAGGGIFSDKNAAAAHSTKTSF